MMWKNENLSYIKRGILGILSQLHPYSVGTDDSNDTGVEKMKLVCIRIVDTSKTIPNHFLDMCLTGGEDGAKAYKIFDAIKNKFSKNDLLLRAF